MTTRRATTRRELLCDTVISVLAAEGGRGLTHRAVDRAAGVPQGTTKNYFPTRESLLRAAAGRMTDLHAEAVARLAATTPEDISPAEVAELYPALLRRAVADDPTQLLAMVELYLEAVRRPGVREALGRMVVANAEAGADLHRAAGLPSSARDAGLLDAYFLGVAVSLLALPGEALRATGLDDPYALGLGLFKAAVPAVARAGRPDGRAQAG
ncbi:TetR/AcrR family transcriptional regulator [Actinosynnema sp. NPDC047251]|uniref:Transcriptional regulator, TetR family n=1 Tax=Saccharothrix espanaensis (strain ATCC 51144 / DSM 44229 / JCM 9112 / NBRC 15066 / NRRL 15764) TaxID=1179773 RepID=K0K4W3_SACES|nr:TetR/AcrR family transcriptional regulator [Saccharothrix espanaensis]CCH31558.1 Transcriptional regulator, TetR family [Saccharothrix espanaensis DSM 44229]